MIKVDRIFMQDAIQMEALGSGGRTNQIAVGNVVRNTFGSGLVGSIHVDIRKGVAIIRREADGKIVPWKTDKGQDAGEALIVVLPPGSTFFGPADLGEKANAGK